MVINQSIRKKIIVNSGNVNLMETLEEVREKSRTKMRSIATHTVKIMQLLHFLLK